MFARIVAHGDDIGNRLSEEIFHVLRSLAGDVDSQLAHRFDRKRIQSLGFNASTQRFEAVSRQLAQDTFCHLAASRVSGTEEEDFGLGRGHGDLFSVAANLAAQQILACLYTYMRIYERMDDLTLCFKGLSDANRLRIVNLLLHGELCGCDIQYVLSAPQPNVSRHLTYLKNAGLVLDRRDGFRIFYRLVQASKGSRKLFEFLSEAFRSNEAFQKDIDRLRHAIRGGACTVSEWRPYSGLVKPIVSNPS